MVKAHQPHSQLDTTMTDFTSTSISLWSGQTAWGSSQIRGARTCSQWRGSHLPVTTLPWERNTDPRPHLPSEVTGKENTV